MSAWPLDTPGYVNLEWAEVWTLCTDFQEALKQDPEGNAKLTTQ